jgi:hypothetical protein
MFLIPFTKMINKMYLDDMTAKVINGTDLRNLPLGETKRHYEHWVFYRVKHFSKKYLFPVIIIQKAIDIFTIGLILGWGTAHYVYGLKRVLFVWVIISFILFLLKRNSVSYIVKMVIWEVKESHHKRLLP